jgi:hypothetical protein
MNYYDWPQIVTRLSDVELATITRNKSAEPDEKIVAVINELKSRGHEVQNNSQIIFKTKVQKQPDENSPVLYSDKVISAFSVLFSVIFGGVLFAINLRTVNNRKGILPVIAFSILYSSISVYILSTVNLGSSSVVLSNALGALIINKPFWNKYIGKEVVYHRKSYKKPLVIALMIFIPLIAFLIWSSSFTGHLV